MNKKQGNDTTKKVLVGAGLMAGAALAAYLLISAEDKEKASLKIKNWMKKMQKDIAEKVKSIQNLTQDKYDQTVDEVKSKYETLKDISSDELSSFANEMKSHWESASKSVKKIGKN